MRLGYLYGPHSADLCAYRTAFRLGLLGNDARWMAMVEDRNRTVHTYDEKAARAIYRALPDYARLLRHLLERVQDARERHRPP